MGCSGSALCRWRVPTLCYLKTTTMPCDAAVAFFAAPTHHPPRVESSWPRPPSPPYFRSRPLAQYSEPRYAWPYPSMGDLGGLMKIRDLALLVALPIGLLIGVSMLTGLADSEMAQFFDHLVMSGVIAYGVVYCFFM